MIITNAFRVARQYLGTSELSGHFHNPLILSMLQLDTKWPQEDEVPWCSAFVNWVAFQLNLPRSKSLAARSWLKIGTELTLEEAEEGDVVVLSRGSAPQPGPEVLDAPGHVGFFAGYLPGSHVLLLGGNQSNQVSIAQYPINRVLSVKRLD